jgi:hypothetical protein
VVAAGAVTIALEARGGEHTATTRATSPSTLAPSGSSSTSLGPPAPAVAALDPNALPTALSRAAVVVDRGQLLILGGLTDHGSSAAVLRFDPATGTFTVAGQLAEPVHDAGAAELGGSVVVFGGGGEAHTVAVVQRLGSAASQVIGSLPQPRSDLVAAAIGGRAYVLGGFDGTTLTPDILETDDGVTFRAVARLPHPVRYPAVAVNGSMIYLVGGQVGGVATNTIQSFNTGTGAVEVVGRLPFAVSDATSWFANGRLYVAGGLRHDQASTAIEVIDPTTGVTTHIGDLPVALADASGAVLGNTAYLFGGEGRTRLRTVVKVTFG